MPKDNKSESIFDLEERTAKFAEVVISLIKRVPRDTVSDTIIRQLVRSATSVGANYCEADCAETRKDFEHKLGICKKEAKETKHWLRMLNTQFEKPDNQIHALTKEAVELNLIFNAIIKKSKLNGTR